nr:MAG TPA: hypothetical protein [Caudoviricetes sp.]
MCDIVISIGCVFSRKRIEAAGFRVCRFSFCTICGIITSTNLPGLSKKRIRVDICQLAQCFILE